MRSFFCWFIRLTQTFAFFLSPSFDQRKPIVLVIFGDDIGQSQIRAYAIGLIGFRAPNIGSEGAIFTEAYGQQSCTSGRASVILGGEPFRTGLLKMREMRSLYGVQPCALSYS